MLSFWRSIPPIVPGRRGSRWASEWAKPPQMSTVGSAVGAAMEAEPSSEADELADGPADFPADAEGAAARAEGGVAVAVALPQAATRGVASAAPSKVRIVALERRIIRLPPSREMPPPLGDRGRLIPPSMESRPCACQTRLGRHSCGLMAAPVVPVLLWRSVGKRKASLSARTRQANDS